MSSNTIYGLPIGFFDRRYVLSSGVTSDLEMGENSLILGLGDLQSVIRSYDDGYGNGVLDISSDALLVTADVLVDGDIEVSGSITGSHSSSDGFAGLTNTYNFDASTPGNVTSMTFKDGLLVAVTTL